MSESAVEERLSNLAPGQVEQRTAPPQESAVERASLLEEMIYEGIWDGVWSYYMSLHPCDRAAVLTELPAGIRRSLALNLVTVFLAAAVIGLFESTIAKVVALAAFLPVVVGQGGIGGTQTVTLVVRSLATGELPRGLGLRILRREIMLGLIHGLVPGAIIGGIGWVWEGNPILGGVLALAMTGNMVVASVAGAGVPLVLRRLRMDPAVSAAVFVTTFTDVIGFALFLGLAAVFIEFLV